MKPMATAISFAPVHRWMLPPNVHVRGGVFVEAAVFRPTSACLVLPIAVFSLLLTSMSSTTVWAGSELAAAADIQQEDRPLEVESGVIYAGHG